LHAVTIAARNYLAMARTVATSFTAANPDSDFTILVVDAQPDEIPGTADYRVATPHDLPLNPTEFGRMAFLYDVTELSTALKPWALEMLLHDGADVAVYLDPDIYVYSTLDEIELESLKHGIVLTPHTVSPMPRDGLRPSEADIMGAGIYNLGFIAVQQGNLDMLTWWQQRLRRDSISAPEQMLFTDQRWIDLVPGYFDHSVLRDPGYNVAYWNLDSRTITRDGDNYAVNGAPLRFFHFSGYRPDTPWILSKYVADNPRVVLSEHPVVRQLCDGYAEQLRAHGMDRSEGTPYRFNRFQDGTPITPSLRRLYRAAVIEAEQNQTEFPPAPFSEPGDDEILAWFREPVRPGTWVNRVVHALWQSRTDLQRAFPHPMGADQEEFLAWCMGSGVRESGLVASLLPTSELAAADSRSVTSTDIPGVNLVGYFHTETGVGQIGRLLVDAVKATGLPYSTVAVTRTVSRQNADFEESASIVRYPVNLVTVNADQFRIWAEEGGQDLLNDRYTVGVWAWEVADFPDAFLPALDLVDEIWAISRFGKAAIEQKTGKPVHVIPYQIPEVRPTQPLDRAAVGIPERPYFLFMFDYLSVFERKNPLGVIDAFTRAFPEPAEDGPILVVKSVNGNRFRTQRERLRSACDGRPDVFLIEDYLDYPVVESLLANCQAYVSLHRAEGLGLTMSEAMSAGRPVIATNYSGNLDFMDADNSMLVPYQLVTIGDNAQPYGPPTQWAEPDLDVAARYLRWLHEHPAEAAELGLRAQESVHSRHDLDQAAEFVAGRVRAVLNDSRTRPDPVSTEPIVPAPQPNESQAVLQRSQALLDSVVQVDTPSRFPVLARTARRLVQRVLAHHDEQVNVRLNALLDTTRVTHQSDDRRISRMEETLVGQLDSMRRLTDDLQNALTAERNAIAELRSRSGNDQVRSTELDKRLTTLTGRVDQLGAADDAAQQRLDVLSELAAQNGAVADAHQRQLAEVADRLQRLSAQLAVLDAENAAVPYQADPAQLRLQDGAGRTVLGFTAGGDGTGGDYAGFEDIFRGDEEFIGERLAPYVPLVADHGPVLDLGCGRGEFLGLLAKNSIAAVGVDTDPSMVERARARGLEVSHGDGLATLRAAGPGSYGAVTSFQVVEHLDLPALRELFTLARRALAPGGVLIAETVNPHAPAALKTFWLDLTHVRPLYPEALLCLAREAGFSSAQIAFPHGVGELTADLRGCGEYALIARTPAG